MVFYRLMDTWQVLTRENQNMHEISVKTRRRCELVDVTRPIADFVAQSGVSNGLVFAYVPHTTAAVTINENADPQVGHDILLTLDELVPPRRAGYLHGEGNSDAHVKASLIGSSVTVMVEDKHLCLGTWQGIYFCEFDGPRVRRLMLKIGQAGLQFAPKDGPLATPGAPGRNVHFF